MAIPSSPQLMRAELGAHEDRAKRRRDQLPARGAVVAGGTESEQSDRQLSGELIFTQRVDSATTYVEQLGYLHLPWSGETHITAEGCAFEAGDPIDPPASDWAAQPVFRESVLLAIGLFRMRDRDGVPRQHGFGRAHDCVVEYDR